MSAIPDMHVYKLVVDNGGAPCVYQNVLSLAICKPKIRKSAKVGALIFGFGGKAYNERLIYIACITDKLEGSDYYRLPEFAMRPDCIYRKDRGAKIKRGALYHTDGSSLKSDVGSNFENAFVLMSRDFRYFGDNGSDSYKNRYPSIKRLIEGLTQGHRRYHSADVRNELLSLKEEMWSYYGRRKLGKPMDSDKTKSCSVDMPCREFKHQTYR